MSVSYAPQQKQYFDRLFTVIDKDDAGVLPGQEALPFLVTSGLPQQTLGEIWASADPDNNGFLTREGWYKAARLIGWMQKGDQAMDETLVSRGGPSPTFAGQAPPSPDFPLSAQSTGQRPPQLTANTAGGSLPILTPADRTKFTRIFVGCGPQNGMLSGDKARDVFIKSQLGYEKLGQIWNLADTQNRGSLDLPDFIIGMFLIQSCMSNPSLQLPSILPPGTYEQASGGRPPQSSGAPSPIGRQNTGGAPSPVRPQYTGAVPSSGILQPQRTGQSLTGQPAASTPPRTASRTVSTSPAASGFAPTGSTVSGVNRGMPAQAQWDVTLEAKATSDRFFAQLDTQNRGVIEGDVAVPFMLQSQLDEGVLASIWDLADIRQEGKLSRDEFAVAMYLINSKLAGQEVPTTLPNSLIPPQLREQYGTSSQNAPSSQMGSSTTKDLFDLFDDPPIAAPVPATARQQTPSHPQPFQAASFLPTPPARRMGAQTTGQRQMSPTPTGQQGEDKYSAFASSARSLPANNDLLGDDSAEPAPVLEDSAEVGNKRNQLANTSRSLTDLESTRGELEKSAASSAGQIAELESKLSEARVKHEAETKAVADLRIRVAGQKTRVQHLNEDVIAAESDVSGMRSEKDELGQGLLRDKEEIRGLQKRMEELEDEKTGLKLVLEKLKKEARQQKGMVTIAKKQLSTAEGSRDSLQKEISEAEDAAKEPSTPVYGKETELSGSLSPVPLNIAAGIPLPSTPRVLSPTPTGTSQRSNNPFGRLVRGSQSLILPPPPPSPPNPSGPSLDVTAPSESSPSLAMGAIAGAGALVSVAAGAAVHGAESAAGAVVHGTENAVGAVTTGAETVYNAAMSVVSPAEGQSDFGDRVPQEAEQELNTVGTGVEDDPFDTSTKEKPPMGHHETDPFGLPSSSDPGKDPVESDFDTGFGDSFSVPKAATRPTEDMHLAPASEELQPASDFDAAFADFDSEKTQEMGSTSVSGIGIPAGITKSAIPADLRPEAERIVSTQATAPESLPQTPVSEVVPSIASLDSPPFVSQEPIPTSAENIEELASSEEEDGPEDLEAPRSDYRSNTGAFGKQDFQPPSTTLSEISQSSEPQSQTNAGIAPALPILSPPLDDNFGKVRRSAPPPPPARSASSVNPTSFVTKDDFDPFGAPASNASNSPANTVLPGAASMSAAPRPARFDDDDDFDFSDLPPAQAQQGAATQHQLAGSNAPSAFDDEFASFDEDFEKSSSQPHSGSDNSTSMTKSYEMVSPQPAQQPFGSQDTAIPSTSSRTYESWGLGGALGQTTIGRVPAQPQSASAFSFDDAFGGEFDTNPPVPGSEPPSQVPKEPQYAPPAGAPPPRTTGTYAPVLPERRATEVNESQPQTDDLEDVKKLCAMGFSRSLAVEALDANDYDFQKALNVLLVK